MSSYYRSYYRGKGTYNKEYWYLFDIRVCRPLPWQGCQRTKQDGIYECRPLGYGFMATVFKTSVRSQQHLISLWTRAWVPSGALIFLFWDSMLSSSLCASNFDLTLEWQLNCVKSLGCRLFSLSISGICDCGWEAYGHYWSFLQQLLLSGNFLDFLLPLMFCSLAFIGLSEGLVFFFLLVF